MEADIQRFGYALFFIKREALEYLDKSKGRKSGRPEHCRGGHELCEYTHERHPKAAIYAFFFSLIKDRWRDLGSRAPKMLGFILTKKKTIFHKETHPFYFAKIHQAPSPSALLLSPPVVSRDPAIFCICIKVKRSISESCTIYPV